MIGQYSYDVGRVSRVEEQLDEILSTDAEIGRELTENFFLSWRTAALLRELRFRSLTSSFWLSARRCSRASTWSTSVTIWVSLSTNCFCKATCEDCGCSSLTLRGSTWRLTPWVSLCSACTSVVGAGAPSHKTNVTQQNSLVVFDLNGTEKALIGKLINSSIVKLNVTV